jgi:hypothetical protein
MLHHRRQALLIEDTAFYHVERAGQTFSSELVLYSLHIGARAGGEIVQYAHLVATS